MKENCVLGYFNKKQKSDAQKKKRPLPPEMVKKSQEGEKNSPPPRNLRPPAVSNVWSLKKKYTDIEALAMKRKKCRKRQKQKLT